MAAGSKSARITPSLGEARLISAMTAGCDASTRFGEAAQRRCGFRLSSQRS